MTSYRTLGRLLRERGPARPSLQAFLDPPAGEKETLGIEALCYRGRAALERASDVRRELVSALQQGRELAAVRPLLDELLDLLPLALGDG